MRFESFVAEQIKSICATLLISRENLAWYSSTSQKVKEAEARRVKCRQYMLKNHVSPELAPFVPEAVADELVSAYSNGMLFKPTMTAADTMHDLVRTTLHDSPMAVMAVDLMLNPALRVADVKHLRFMNSYREITVNDDTVYFAVDVYRHGHYAAKENPITLVSPDSAQQWATTEAGDDLQFRLFRAFIAGNLHDVARRHTTTVENERHVTCLHPLVTLPAEWTNVVADTWQTWNASVVELSKQMGLDEDV